ncbi:Oidioi.mRNA.OKI2018_I69.PAR.g10857.t1.cds [Oikopleura dioica]|uniref:Oidioi.mRNA.OKI2018_I69.PAR.g10857.t1.cds n=1 Tax=Oikopleura dioica TaxID=34765 RepID=A0ABN7RXX5_OIKDI|nr:Oidioi.mRNA.OKI2018_I69.PAR.g10857.t1.cds [Oikopleura dioica]
MKFATALIASAAAFDPVNWPGQSDEDPCGTQIQFEKTAVNSTCTLDFNGYNPWRVFLGGEFIIDEYSFTNFDGIGSDTIDVVIFWEQSFDASTGILNNATCGTDVDVTLSCTDEGYALPGLYFMETANDFRMAKESNYNFQVAGAQPGDVVAMQLNDAVGNGFACMNLTTNSGEINVDGINVIQDPWGNLYSDTGLVTINVADYASSTVNLFTTQQPGQPWEPSLWKSSVSN